MRVYQNVEKKKFEMKNKIKQNLFTFVNTQ